MFNVGVNYEAVEREAHEKNFQEHAVPSASPFSLCTHVTKLTLLPPFPAGANHTTEVTDAMQLALRGGSTG